MEITNCLSTDIIKPNRAEGAIINDEYTGFKTDYLVLHCLLRLYQGRIKNFLEIGTNMGTGTNIICNALNVDATHGGVPKVFSLDLPPEQAHVSLQHPISEGKGNSTGHKCTFTYTQLFGDSQNFNYGNLPPMDAMYIDAEHTFANVHQETSMMLRTFKPQLMVWHDTDIVEVLDGIKTAFYHYNKRSLVKTPLNLYRVADSRISFAVIEPLFEIAK